MLTLQTKRYSHSASLAKFTVSLFSSPDGTEHMPVHCGGEGCDGQTSEKRRR